MYPLHPAAIPVEPILSGPYRTRFAISREDLRRVQRLRFEVFNVELNEGLDESYTTGLDADSFDERCHHLMVEERSTGEVVGTYRLMTAELAQGKGFYSATEFDLRTLPADVTANGVEAGRACVSANHRSGRVVNLLWKGLAQYMAHNNKRYFFGCCSLAGRSPGVGLQAYMQLLEQGHLASDFLVDAVAACSCEGGDVRAFESAELPPLLRMYLQLGAKVASHPAIDRDFGVIDFLVLLDIKAISESTRKRYFPTASVELPAFTVESLVA